ncbi:MULTISPECIES: alpha/beta hydrolase [Streptomycetaceae]|uniref:Acyl-CoA:diacylglycerol acyltransferase n=1 Tax=Streptantibioticus cattleyicolor (strain ATCC 35852 / DSM 46488 / JCM 4925 / NBRC 14057 / NRRL 8057) TaxID=1003195 RepID=G8WYP0_STREN|nr:MULTISPECIES: alpha/beta hydrolase-fold protein [Streptomycetaceae]AEW92431.1 putative sugar/fatty acid transferase [Streptantibioticus cattleyicolor NRRL 8057 = DSM 46488]MYS57239.1 esterase [Streptomyces sp. SID5468]
MPSHRAHPSRRAALARLLAVAAGAAVARPPSAAAATPADATADDGARVVATTWLDARTADLVVDSPAVGARVPLRLLLPAGWAGRPERTWPVLHLLHGAHDDYTSWTRETGIAGFTADKDVITVMPSAGPTGIPSRWWDWGSADPPDYEAFAVDEVMQLLRRGYRANGVRVVAGVSTGGYGALALAARHPGAFAAAASYSGITYTTLVGVPEVVGAIVTRELLDPLSLWGDPVLLRSLWQEHDPYVRAPALRGTALYVSCGAGLVGGGLFDPSGQAMESALWPTALAFTQRLTDLGIPARTHLYPGGAHNWTYWQREFLASWPVLAAGLGLPS